MKACTRASSGSSRNGDGKILPAWPPLGRNRPAVAELSRTFAWPEICNEFRRSEL